MSAQRCPSCSKYRAALITYKGETRCTTCLVDRIAALEAQLAEAKALLQAIDMNERYCGIAGTVMNPQARGGWLEWADRRDAALTKAEDREESND